MVTQHTKYSGSFSSDLAIKSGVLQGKVIGPILFNIFINNLLKKLSADNVVACTFDLIIACRGDRHVSVHVKMQNLLTDIQDWLNRHYLKINAIKSFATEIKSRKSTAQLDSLYINGCKISKSMKPRFTEKSSRQTFLSHHI